MAVATVISTIYRALPHDWPECHNLPVQPQPETELVWVSEQITHPVGVQGEYEPTADSFRWLDTRSVERTGVSKFVVDGYGPTRRTQVNITMERRKFLIGAGSLAAGGAAALGSGAFSSVEANRDVSANIASDDQALLALRDETNGAIVRQNGSDQLVIDFTANGRASGINPNSIHQIGTFGIFSGKGELKSEPNGAYNDPAFNIRNQTSQTQEVTMTFDGKANNCMLAMQVDRGLEDDIGRDTLVAADDDSSVAANNRDDSDGVTEAYRREAGISLPSGERAGVAVLVNTRAYNLPGNIDADAPADTSADLSGTLTISATDPDN